MAIYRVAAHTGANDNGYIEYNTETKQVSAHFPDEAVNRRAMAYLTQEQEMHRLVDLATYETVRAVPASGWENLKLALCYIWTRAGIYIDWSRPVDLNE